MQQRRGRQRRLVRKVGRAHFAVARAMLIQVGQVAGELDDVLEAAADRRERGLDVLKYLHGLSANTLGGFATRVDATSGAARQGNERVDASSQVLGVDLVGSRIGRV